MTREDKNKMVFFSSSESMQMRFCKGHSCEYSLHYPLFYLNALLHELCFCCGLLIEDDSSYEIIKVWKLPWRKQCYLSAVVFCGDDLEFIQRFLWNIGLNGFRSTFRRKWWGGCKKPRCFYNWGTKLLEGNQKSNKIVLQLRFLYWDLGGLSLCRRLASRIFCDLGNSVSLLSFFPFRCSWAQFCLGM